MNTINQTALIGSIINRMSMPGIAPRIAPTIGTSAVIPTIVLIKSGYGKRNNVMPIKHITPKITASMTCPKINFENVSEVIFCISNNFALTFSGR